MGNASLNEDQFDAYLEETVSAQLSTVIASAMAGKTPYTFKVYLKPQGLPRQPINDTLFCEDHDTLIAENTSYTCAQIAASPASSVWCAAFAGYCDKSCGLCNAPPHLTDEATLLATASDTCYNWDEGKVNSRLSCEYQDHFFVMFRPFYLQ